jgi:hypothetical protein
MKCETTTCEGLRGWRFTWPGRPELQVCARCAARAAGVAKHMGFDLEVKPLTLVMCEPHHVAHAEKLGQLQTTATAEACAAVAAELRTLDREIMQCDNCKRL